MAGYFTGGIVLLKGDGYKCFKSIMWFNAIAPTPLASLKMNTENSQSVVKSKPLVACCVALSYRYQWQHHQAVLSFRHLNGWLL
jgi:hypothetical protein